MNLNSKMSAHCLWGLNKKCDYEWKAETGNTNIHCQSLSRCLKELRACWPLLSIALHPTNTPQTPHTRWQKRAPFSSLFKPGTKPPHRVILLRTLSLSAPPTHHHHPAAVNPGGVKSLSLVFSFNYPLLALTSLKSLSLLSPHPPITLHTMFTLNTLWIESLFFLFMYPWSQSFCYYCKSNNYFATSAVFLLKNKPRKDVQILTWSWKRLTALTKFSNGFTTNKTKNTKDIAIKS